MVSYWRFVWYDWRIFEGKKIMKFFKSAISRFGALIVMFSFLAFSLLSVPALAYTYGSSYPDYLPFVGAHYIEVQSSLGRGSIIVSTTVPDRSLSVSSINSNIYNTTNSNISGVFRTENGSDYSIRFPSFSYPEYAVTSGYNTSWTPLTVSQILNTNFQFVDFKNSDKQNDTFIFTDNLQRADFVFNVLFCALLVAIVCLILFRRSDRL